MIKKNKASANTWPLFFILFCYIFNISNTLHATISFEDDDFDSMITEITNNETGILRTCEPTEAGNWNFLLTILNIPQALDLPFYLHTQLPRSRNLLNFPNFQLCSYQPIVKDNSFSWHFFYNQTTHKSFTKSENDINGTRVGSYLDLQQGTFFQLLKGIANASFLPDALKPLAQLNYPIIFNNIANARLEERRMGFLAHYYHAFSERTYFEVKTPFFWMIKNIQLTDQEKMVLDEKFSASSNSNFTNFDLNEYAKQHIIFDALGSGTTEISISSLLLKGDNWHVDMGGFVFLPTDYQWARGLYGTYIQPHNQRPILDLCSLVNITNQTLSPDAGQELSNYLNAALDQFSSAVLQCPLGYYNTMTLGLKLSPYWKPHDNLEFHGLYTFEFLFPYTQPRFYVRKDQGDFSKIYFAMPTDTDLEQQAKLDFLEARISELLFPLVLNTKLWPGFIINTTSTLHKTYKTWDFVLGYNCWMQSSENFVNIEVPTTLVIDDLDIKKSEAQDAYMIKVLGKVHKDIALARHTMSLTLWADFAILSNTVGNDFTFGICFDRQF